MKRYKVLSKNMTGPYQLGFEYRKGVWYRCDNFDSDKSNDCSHGFYATPTIEGVLYCNLANKKRVFECEVDGRAVEIDVFKNRYEKIKIVRELKENEIRKLAKAVGRIRGYDIEHAIYPINPLLIKPKKVTKRDVELVKAWASVRYWVRYSVGYSIWNSVRYSVGYSVGDSVRYCVGASVRDWVRYSVGYSVWDSVGDLVWAYVSSLFSNIKKWKYIKHKKGVNPFQPAIDLWMRGFILSFDGKIWRLHSGKKATVVKEIELG